MPTKSLHDPFDANADLRHGSSCRHGHTGPGSCSCFDTASPDLEEKLERHATHEPVQADAHATGEDLSDEAMVDRAVESAIVRGMFGHNEINRRRFLQMIGGGTVAAALGSILPLDKVKAAIKDGGPLEKTKLRVGFVPITCATPIIMAHPMGFYERHGLDVDVIKTAGWAVARDMSLSGEYDASHMLSPMPLSMTLGSGSSREHYIMPAVENINGQAITLHNKHKDKRDPKDWKGFTFAVPFEYSMHNFLLRYYVAEHGLDPDRDISIRVVPPPEMVANLRAENVDGYLAPDPFNQRAVWDGIGFIHMLTKEIWDGHPCCAFACSAAFADEHPNTFGALFRALIEATQYSSDINNRAEIAEAISPRAYLNQPQSVVEQVLTGRYADGLGEVKNDPHRIDFDPFPWHSMATWILTQMKRWGYVDRDFDYNRLAEDVFLASECAEVMTELGYEAPSDTYKNFEIMGKVFDYTDPEGYLDSFAIRRS
ncbi:MULTISPECIES: CmpA/NrtA family ABC transporter substrate-binding protein [unclassified Thioalkalivibrio]|uniref:CmpA/NrtA family ABC transporter substrate-binding protein n=1 Tax=unclassified Thioalkalivibrio TaxID=2621013 RepID=UPI00036647FB|nr:MULTISPECIES: CmpA/NrtA family ABC transporter substrate-binding protein [unclassified Thioalkalivibrio]